MDGRIKIGVVGCAGRMGRMILAQVSNEEDCVLIGATERPGHLMIGQDIKTLHEQGENQVSISDDPAQVIAAADAIIDFTSPEATLEHARLAAQAGAAIIVGTTGINEAQGEELARAARHVPVVWAPNMSVGVTLLLALTEQAARLLDNSFDIEIVEMHHRDKVDAPSGTALGLGRAAAVGRSVNFEKAKQTVRDGYTGQRPNGEIGFATLRGGDVVGDHTVVFAGGGERVELSHKSVSRTIFAQGAIRATRWAVGREPGLYSMRNVVGFEN